ncbi:MAG: hypothetical protein V2J12_05665 [Gammaproteobacteria bacterium]|jgi:hypothetical protein|nr:hypothetical protein [Gammaproteobacteria bacterium]
MFTIRKVSDRRAPAGLERVILRKLPLWCLGGTAVPGLVALLNHWLPASGVAADVAKRQFIVDALCYGTVFTVWTAVFTVAIGCYVVVVMKGPHYAADSYPVEHANRPARGDRYRPD